MNSSHWLRAFLILLGTCAVVVILSSPAVSEEHAKHHQHQHQCPSYSDIDANADNAVSSEEFYLFRAQRMSEHAEEGRKMKNAKNAPAFEDLDLDGDGNLSADEFAEHQSECPMKKKKQEAATAE
jgi:Ca2+-binding EF-hand superfamily protein